MESVCQRLSRPDICPRHEQQQKQQQLSILRNNKLLRANVESRECTRAGRQILRRRVSSSWLWGLFNVNKWNRNKYLTRIAGALSWLPVCVYRAATTLGYHAPCCPLPVALAIFPGIPRQLVNFSATLYCRLCRLSLRRRCCSTSSSPSLPVCLLFFLSDLSLFLSVAYLSQHQQLKALACFTLWNQLQDTSHFPLPLPLLPIPFHCFCPFLCPLPAQVFMFVLAATHKLAGNPAERESPECCQKSHRMCLSLYIVYVCVCVQLLS